MRMAKIFSVSQKGNWWHLHLVVADPDVTGFAENITNSLSGMKNNFSAILINFRKHCNLGNIHYPAKLELEIWYVLVHLHPQSTPLQPPSWLYTLQGTGQLRILLGSNFFPRTPLGFPWCPNIVYLLPGLGIGIQSLSSKWVISSADQFHSWANIW